jgi:hypothetical protein
MCQQMANIYVEAGKTRLLFIYRMIFPIIFCLSLFMLSIIILLSPPQHQVIAQSSSPEQSLTSADSNQTTMNLEAARQQYLLAWNNTAFSSQFDVFIQEGSVLGYGVYREHVPTNVFRPGETIVLYVEPVGFGHKPINDISQDGGSNTTTRTLYLVNMTADIIISDSAGSELLTIKDVPVGSLLSHRQNTELFLTLRLTQNQQSLPVGDYVITYVIHDQVSRETFQIEKRITIADNATSAAPTLTEDNNFMQPVPPQQQ